MSTATISAHSGRPRPPSWPTTCAYGIVGLTVVYALFFTCFCIVRYPHIEHFYQLFHHPRDCGMFLADCAALPLAVVGFVRRKSLTTFIAIPLTLAVIVTSWPLRLI